MLLHEKDTIRGGICLQTGVAWQATNGAIEPILCRMPSDETEACGRVQSTSALVLETRGAWLRNDPTALINALRRIAPRCKYNSREVCRALGVTARHLQRIFARHMDASPQDWLNEQRLLAARDLLCQRNSVKEVAFALGFRTVSQLSRDFKNRFGVPPKAMLDVPPKVMIDTPLGERRQRDLGRRDPVAR
jgi:AraC-like DNA-binding protein